MSDETVPPEPSAPTSISIEPATAEKHNVVKLAIPERHDAWPPGSDLLRNLLALAADGQIIQLGVCYQRVDGRATYHAITRAGSSPGVLIGELELLKSALIRLCPAPSSRST